MNATVLCFPHITASVKILDDIKVVELARCLIGDGEVFTFNFWGVKRKGRVRAIWAKGKEGSGVEEREGGETLRKFVIDRQESY